MDLRDKMMAGNNDMVIDDASDEGDEGGDEELLRDIREKYKEAEEFWSDNRKWALEDIRFGNGEQWPEDVVALRESEKRPCLVVDKLNQYVRQIVNDGRQNRPSIKVRPVDSGADVETATVYQGVIKHIEERSGADAAYDCALNSAATNGFGFFRILTEYAGDATFDQELVIRRVKNPLSVLLSPNVQEADGSDMRYAFFLETMPKDEFERQFPGKLPEDFETNDSYQGWFGEEVLVAEYWCVKEEKRTLHLLADGAVLSKADFDLLGEDGEFLLVEKRNIPKRTVWRAKVSGKDFLEPMTEWPGKYIPLLVVYGNELDVEGKTILSGIIRPAKDAQRLYNYSRSAFAERVALTPKAPWVAAEGQVEDYEKDWNTANTASHSVLRYRPTSLNGQPLPPPARTSASDIPAGFAQDMQISEHDIQGAIGMYAASLGAPSNERSGKAILARQKEGDVGTFHYHDNLNRAIRHAGRILVDLIPKIYDSSRVVRILGYDGTSDNAEIDPSLPVAHEKQGVKTIYNLGVGSYDVTVTTGPSYNTLRQEAAESMAEMVQANPNLMAIIGDLLVKNMDWPGADEISDRLKLALAPEIRQAVDAEKDISPELQQAQAAFEQQMQEARQMMDQAAQKIEELQKEVDKNAEANRIKQQEVEVKAAETEIKAYQAETQRLSAVATAMSPEQIQEIVLQTLQDLFTPMQGSDLPQSESPDTGSANTTPQVVESPMEQ